MRRILALFVLLAAAAPPVLGAARVEGLQMPAWLERGDARSALTAGARLLPGDRVATGGGARVLLRLDEGSHVKLGENARFDLRELTPPAQQGGVFRGFLDVLRGAFRFTTTALSRASRRDLEIRVAGVTAGVRGTDLWGKAAADRDIVCLIEGSITVQRAGDPPLRMEEPLTFYVAPKDAPPLPVAPVDPQRLQQWAQETELQPGAGVLRGEGDWVVHLKSMRREDLAAAAAAELGDAGYAASVAPAEVAGATWYRVSVTGFATRAEAEGLADRLEGRFGIRDAWVTR